MLSAAYAILGIGQTGGKVVVRDDLFEDKGDLRVEALRIGDRRLEPATTPVDAFRPERQTTRYPVNAGTHHHVDNWFAVRSDGGGGRIAAVGRAAGPGGIAGVRLPSGKLDVRPKPTSRCSKYKQTVRKLLRHSQRCPNFGA